MQGWKTRSTLWWYWEKGEFSVHALFTFFFLLKYKPEYCNLLCLRPTLALFLLFWLCFKAFTELQTGWGWKSRNHVVQTPARSSVSWVRLLRAVSSLVLSIRSLMKMLNITGPSVYLQGAPVVAGLQLDFMPCITSLRAQQFSQISIHLTICLAYASSVCQWGCYGRQC